MRRTVALGVLGALALGGGGLVFVKYFAPTKGEHVDESFVDSGQKLLRKGEFSGTDAAHDVSGRVSLFEGDDGAVLRLEDYDATDGPDVFLYVSKNVNAEFDESEAIRVEIKGTAEGQATLRGNFNVPLADSVAAKDIKSVIIYCKRFGVTFGSAKLGD